MVGKLNTYTPFLHKAELNKYHKKIQAILFLRCHGVERIVLRLCLKWSSLAQWCMPIVPAPRRQRQEDHKFEVSLGYIVRL
jgi:hypothetical protein